MIEQLPRALPGLRAERRRGSQGAGWDRLGAEASATGLQGSPHGAVRPDQGEQREAGAREALTHEVGQQDDQRG